MSQPRTISPARWAYYEAAALPLSAAALNAALGGRADFVEVIGGAGGSYTLVVKNAQGVTQTIPTRPDSWKLIAQCSEITSTTATGVIVGRAAETNF